MRQAAKLGLATAKLGLGLVNGGLWRSVRRCSSLATRSSTVYLCFKEKIYGHVSAKYVVRSIDLNDGDCKESPVEAYITFKNGGNFDYMLSSSRLGSRIIVPRYSDEGVEDFFCTDTSKRPMNFEVISPLDYSLLSKTTIPPVRVLKMGEIDGKLYLVDFGNKNLFMYDAAYNYQTQIYDPIINLFEILDRDQSPDPRPSSVSLNFPDRMLGWSEALFFAESKKIVAHSYFGTRCIDVADPNIGWVKVNDEFLESMLRWIEIQPHSYIIAHNRHDDIGDFNLIFCLDNTTDPCNIFAFFVSNSCDSAKPVRHTIELPAVCSDYIVDGDIGTYDFEFVHLGPKKFGLVLNKFTEGRDYEDAPSGNFVLLITYEYDIVVTPPSAQDDSSKPNVDIKSRLLGIRTFQYEATTEIGNTDLIGAFMIPEST